MNKTLITLIMLPAAIMASAQQPVSNQPAVVYYMPKTTIYLEAEYTQHTLEAGPFAGFAAEMLGATDVVEADRVYYQIDNIQTGTRTQTDYDRVFRLTADNGLLYQYVRLDKNGILTSYNSAPQKDKKEQPAKTEQPATNAAPVALRKPMPIQEDMFGIDDRRQLAESIARQIMRIRETRLYVLSGEVEHAPADGLAMQQVLDEMNKQETEMVELFVGRHTIRHLSKRFYYTPDQTRTDTIGYFSTSLGATTTRQNDSQPLVIDITCHYQQADTTTAPEKQTKSLFHKEVKPSMLYYNLPGHASYTAYLGTQVMAERELPIAQFGIAIPLADQLFMQKKQPVILFDNKTGNLIEIRQ